MTRGIQCILDSSILTFIQSLFEWSLDYFVPSCSRVDAENRYLPVNYQDFSLKKDDVIFRGNCAIWEMVIHGYPKGESPKTLEIYEDYLNSTCEVCMIYYDCNYLEIYIKDEGRRNCAWNTLIILGAKNIEWITDENDKRTGLSY